MNPFNNPQIEVEGLPEAESLNFQSLEPSYKNVMLISNTIFWGIVITGASIALYTTKEDIPSLALKIAPLVLLTVMILTFLSIFFGFKNKLFAVRHQDLNYKKGWLWKSRMVVPFKRIQHSEVTQGPVDRVFNLAKLRVFTAGGSGSDLTIPGLKLEEANKLKTLITSRITEKPLSVIEAIDHQAIDHQAIDHPTIDNQVNDMTTIDNQLAHNQFIENQLSDDQATDDQLVDNNTIDDQLADNNLTDNSTLDGREEE